MENIKGYDIPERTTRAIDRAHEAGKPVVYIVLSCPDYLSENGKYVFGELNEGVPLLARLHTEALRESIESENSSNSCFNVLIADVESHNRFLVDLYTGGDYLEYQRRCDASKEAVGEYLKTQFSKANAFSSSFLSYFEVTANPTKFGHPMGLRGEDFLRFFEDQADQSCNGQFIDTREAFYELLLKKFGYDKKFENKVLNRVRTKQGSGYYKKEYGGKISIEEQILQEMTTMAEYLTLGYLIAKKSYEEGVQPIIVSHATENTFMFNKVGVHSGFRPEDLNDAIDYPRTPLILRTEPII